MLAEIALLKSEGKQLDERVKLLQNRVLQSLAGTKQVRCPGVSERAKATVVANSTITSVAWAKLLEAHPEVHELTEPFTTTSTRLGYVQTYNFEEK